MRVMRLGDFYRYFENGCIGPIGLSQSKDIYGLYLYSNLNSNIPILL